MVIHDEQVYSSGISYVIKNTKELMRYLIRENYIITTSKRLKSIKSVDEHSDDIFDVTTGIYADSFE